MVKDMWLFIAVCKTFSYFSNFDSTIYFISFPDVLHTACIPMRPLPENFTVDNTTCTFYTYIDTMHYVNIIAAEVHFPIFTNSFCFLGRRTRIADIELVEQTHDISHQHTDDAYLLSWLVVQPSWSPILKATNKLPETWHMCVLISVVTDRGVPMKSEKTKYGRTKSGQRSINAETS